MHNALSEADLVECERLINIQFDTLDAAKPASERLSLGIVESKKNERPSNVISGQDHS